MKRLLFIIAGAFFLVVLSILLLTSTYRSDGSGVSYLSKEPFFEIAWGPANRWIIDSGVNCVWNKKVGPPGTTVEVPILPSTRASLRLWMPRWSREKREADSSASAIRGE